MGSIDKACISGFLCRLCSEMHRIVIHIYGDQGQRLCLVEKINGYLPITISPTDPLPKTICTTCLRRVEQHYDLLMRLSRIKEERFLRVNKRPRVTPISSIEHSEDEVYHSDDDSQRQNQRESLQRRTTDSLQQIAPTTSSTLAAPSSFLTTVLTASSNTADFNLINAAPNGNIVDDDDSAANTSANALAAVTQNVMNDLILDESSSSTYHNSMEGGLAIALQQHTD